MSVYTGVILEADRLCGPSMVFFNLVNERLVAVPIPAFNGDISVTTPRAQAIDLGTRDCWDGQGSRAKVWAGPHENMRRRAVCIPRTYFMERTERMNAAAGRILEVFHTSGLRAGGFVHFADFRDAVGWERGVVRDTSVREALAYLVAEHYVVEYASGLQLSDKGARHLYPTVSL